MTKQLFDRETTGDAEIVRNPVVPGKTPGYRPEDWKEPEPEQSTEIITRADDRDAMTAFAQTGIGVDHAAAIANQLDAIVKAKKLSVVIKGKAHLFVEAWCTCGALCGLSPRTVWSRRITDSNGNILAYESRVEVVRLSTDTVVGAAECECWLDEKLKGYTRWPEKHQAKSMSQTRATSKALAQLLRWIPVLAGYAGTPAEEANDDAPPQHDNPDPAPGAPTAQPRDQRASEADLAGLLDLYRTRKPAPHSAKPFALWAQSVLNRNVDPALVLKASSWTASEIKACRDALSGGST